MFSDAGRVRLIDLGMCVRVPRLPPAPTSPPVGLRGGARPCQYEEEEEQQRRRPRVKLSRQPRRGKVRVFFGLWVFMGGRGSWTVT